MASILAGDIRKGSTFEYNGKGVYTVTEPEKPPTAGTK